MIRRLLLLSAAVAVAACGKDGPVTCDEDSAFGMHGAADDAQTLAPNAPSSGFVCGFERDWWVVSAMEGCSLIFDLSFQNADGDLGMALYVVDEEPSLIDMSFGDGDTERVGLNVTDAREYYAEVRAQGGRAESAKAAYDLTATLDCGDLPATDTTRIRRWA